jgi:hypothetical protein
MTVFYGSEEEVQQIIGGAMSSDNVTGIIAGDRGTVQEVLDKSMSSGNISDANTPETKQSNQEKEKEHESRQNVSLRISASS